MEKFLDRVFSTALERKSSDIHIEPFAEFFRIRFRIDGILINAEEMNIEYYPQ